MRWAEQSSERAIMLRYTYTYISYVVSNYSTLHIVAFRRLCPRVPAVGSAMRASCQTASQNSSFHLLVHPICLFRSRNLATPHSHETTWRKCEWRVRWRRVQHGAIVGVIRWLLWIRANNKFLRVNQSSYLEDQPRKERIWFPCLLITNRCDT